MNKQNFKNVWKSCAICGQDRIELLDVHRINYGQEYSEGNCVCLCVTCHRKEHRNLLSITEKRYSTSGWVLIWEENGEEKIKNII